MMVKVSAISGDPLLNDLKISMSSGKLGPMDLIREVGQNIKYKKMDSSPL